MATFQNLTVAQQRSLRKQLERELADRGIEQVDTVLEPAGLPGRYRLYVTAPDFARLDYSDRLAIVSSALEDAWDRKDRLRLTLQFALSPDEIGAPARKRRTRKRTA